MQSKTFSCTPRRVFNSLDASDRVAHRDRNLASAVVSTLSLRGQVFSVLVSIAQTRMPSDTRLKIMKSMNIPTNNFSVLESGAHKRAAIPCPCITQGMSSLGREPACRFTALLDSLECLRIATSVLPRSPSTKPRHFFIGFCEHRPVGAIVHAVNISVLV